MPAIGREIVMVETHAKIDQIRSALRFFFAGTAAAASQAAAQTKTSTIFFQEEPPLALVEIVQEEHRVRPQVHPSGIYLCRHSVLLLVQQYGATRTKHQCVLHITSTRVSLFARCCLGCVCCNLRARLIAILELQY